MSLTESRVPDPESRPFGPGVSLRAIAGLAVLTADRLDRPGIVHAFTTRLGGESEGRYASLNLGRGVRDPAVFRNRARVAAALGLDPARAVEARQVHGTRVVVVTSADAAAPVAAADGLITDEPGVSLHIHSADCAVILVYDPDRPAVGAAHAGWRGAAGGMGRALVGAMRRAFGSDPARLRTAIGPTIGPCCYEVDAPVHGAFARWPWRDRVMTPGRPGHWHLDVAASLARQLEDAGVPASSVVTMRACTRDRPDLFYSYRRDGPSGRLAGIIALRP